MAQQALPDIELHFGILANAAIIARLCSLDWEMRRKAIVLLSGGLDSMLAARLMQEQGIIVEGINFYTGFCIENHTRMIQGHSGERRHQALWVAERLDIPLHIVDVSEAYHQVLLQPQYGYGATLNPCLDCKIFMVKQAAMFLEKATEVASARAVDRGADFLVTGEVIGQRLKSQLKWTMPLIARESGVNDRLLRPLSAQILPPTLPEREGWVDRARLFGFNGRSRQPQIELAQSLGFTEWAQPAGGCCFLTDAAYSRKLQDLWSARGARDYTLDDVVLLKVGRHIRPQPHFKLIISRNAGETQFLEGYRRTLYSMQALSHAGPLALVDGELRPEDHQVAARIVARYSQGKAAEQVTVGLFDRQKMLERRWEVVPFAAGDVEGSWHVGC